MATVQISADLRFSVQLPGHEPVCGAVTGSGNRVVVRLSNPAHFAGGSDAAHLRGLAAVLAARGVTVVVVAGDLVLLEVGRTTAPWWQRPLTRSRHLRITSMRGAVTGVAGRFRRVGQAAVLPGSELLPPTTLFPVAPTFRRGSSELTTTHDPRRGGRPRLVLAAGNSRLPDDRRAVFRLRDGVTTVGSDPACDICLADLDPVHAVVVHDDRDELVVQDRSADGSTTVNGERVVGGHLLRTGARVDLGPWTLTYRRAEYADHGRPFGGRAGGEIGHQRSQAAPRSLTSVDGVDPS